MSIKIKNWQKFQHFKDRRPPWIKLHRTLLEDVDFNEMPAEDARILIKLWLIASEGNGELPCTRKIAYRLRISESELKQILNRLSHWLEQDDITMISDGYQVGPPETETETETEKKEDAADAALSPDGELFKRGKEVVGEKGGGLIAKLKKHHRGNVALARATIEMASTKQNPREYVCAVLKGGSPSEGGKRLTADEEYWGVGRIPGVA